MPTGLSRMRRQGRVDQLLGVADYPENAIRVMLE
jgi:hypothetical protein